MFKLITIFIAVSNLFVVHLKATELAVTKEFYTAKNVPAQYRAPNNDSDCTVIFVDGWADKAIVNICERSILQDKKKKLGCQLVQDGRINMCVSPLGYIPGFPVKYTFSDSHTEQEVEVVPRPIYVKSSIDKAQIDAQITLPSPVTYRIQFSNIEVGEEISFTSTSYDEKLSYPLAIDKSYVMYYQPEVIGKRGGVAQLSFKRPSGEVLKLDLPWGLEWQRYILVYDQNQKPKSFVDTEEFRKNFPDDAKYFDAKSK